MCTGYPDLYRMYYTLDAALLKEIEKLQNDLDRANEKLQSNNTLLKDEDKATVSLFCLNPCYCV